MRVSQNRSPAVTYNPGTGPRFYERRGRRQEDLYPAFTPEPPPPIREPQPPGPIDLEQGIRTGGNPLQELGGWHQSVAMGQAGAMQADEASNVNAANRAQVGQMNVGMMAERDARLAYNQGIQQGLERDIRSRGLGMSLGLAESRLATEYMQNNMNEINDFVAMQMLRLRGHDLEGAINAADRYNPYG